MKTTKYIALLTTPAALYAAFGAWQLASGSVADWFAADFWIGCGVAVWQFAWTVYGIFR